MCICVYECLCLFSIFLSQRYKCNFFIISLVVFVVCNNCLSNKVVFCSCCCYYCYHCCSLLLKKLPPFFLLISGSLHFFLHFSLCQCFFVFISSFIPFAFLNVLCLCYITSYISLSLENKYNKKWKSFPTKYYSGIVLLYCCRCMWMRVDVCRKQKRFSFIHWFILSNV